MKSTLRTHIGKTLATNLWVIMIWETQERTQA